MSGVADRIDIAFARAAWRPSAMLGAASALWRAASSDSLLYLIVQWGQLS